MAKHHECYLVSFDELDFEPDAKQELGVIEWRILPPAPKQGRSRRRLLRLSNANLLQLSVPDYLANTRQIVRDLCELWDIDLIFCLSPGIAEVIIDLDLPKVLDYCDSGTLTMQRALANRRSEFSLRQKVALHLRKLRQSSLERTFLKAFDCTTTISGADKESFLEVSGVAPGKVEVVPNGVADEALDAGRIKRERQRSVVFWGNLDFPPNWTAVKYFHEHIYVPYLARENIEWHIYGRGAPESIQRITEQDGVTLHGFVDDLFAAVAGHGVMINPMVEGSGLKNKVLEAFACRVPVVSTSLGIEAIDAIPDRHYVKADSPRVFAESVISLLADPEYASEIAAAARSFVESKYRWSAIGDQLDGLTNRAFNQTNDCRQGELASRAGVQR
jgi:glycosyltransferase involved in cell wall biosynthesis